VNPQGLLFDADTMPAATGLLGTVRFPNGLDMRMGRVVRTLAQCADIAILGGEYLRTYYIAPQPRIGYGDRPLDEAADEDVVARFDGMAERWIAETAAQSSLVRIFSHDAYLEILTLGRDAIPRLLERLDDEPERWVGALRIITKEPIGADATSAQEAVTAWRRWGREHGYRR
jgi:hypothetical protein